ncbi:MAG TPA: nucleotidyltransferase family protein [Geobacteraceae bacterium]|nr:nucleotidyltransferase family protein [Geobacteraceae bacterium]
MKPIEEIQTIIREHKTELTERFGVSEIGVFGSVVRGEARDESDVDVLVEFGRPIGFNKFMDLEFYLEEILGVAKVDLVTKSGLKPYIGQHILREVRYV